MMREVVIHRDNPIKIPFSFDMDLEEELAMEHIGNFVPHKALIARCAASQDILENNMRPTPRGAMRSYCVVDHSLPLAWEVRTKLRHAS